MNRRMFSVRAISVGRRSMLEAPKNPTTPRVQQMHDAAVAINPDVIVLCHGGPIAEPDDAQYVLDQFPRPDRLRGL